MSERFKIILEMCFLTSVPSPKGGPIHHASSDHYYSPPRGPKEDRNWSPHMDGYELMVGGFSAARLIICHLPNKEQDITTLNSLSLDVLI